MIDEKGVIGIAEPLHMTIEKGDVDAIEVNQGFGGMLLDAQEIVTAFKVHTVGAVQVHPTHGFGWALDLGQSQRAGMRPPSGD